MKKITLFIGLNDKDTKTQQGTRRGPCVRIPEPRSPVRDGWTRDRRGHVPQGDSGPEEQGVAQVPEDLRGTGPFLKIGGIMIQKFFTRNLAEKVAEEKNASDQVYYLRNGEAGRPDYKAVKYRDGYAVKVTYCFYAGTFNAPKNHLLTTEEI